ncbi:hypothetical protein Bca52824_002773 [Brassica carinata]|uniref:Uncharacterized protein n=1 Tax=Brassica carinata TaxID=52824 RepID=A0A8X7WIH1_BRACI|nr:hypothetical protein Bca52824_002773 [Brassica carinata]
MESDNKVRRETWTSAPVCIHRRRDNLRTASSETTLAEHPESITNRHIFPFTVQVELNNDVRCQASFVFGARQLRRSMRSVPVSPVTCSSSTSSSLSSS